MFVKFIVGNYCSESFCTVWIHHFLMHTFEPGRKIEPPPMAIAFTQLHRSVWVSSSLSLSFYSSPLQYVAIGPFRGYCILFLSYGKNVMESGKRNFGEVCNIVLSLDLRAICMLQLFLDFCDNCLGDEISAWDGIGCR